MIALVNGKEGGELLLFKAADDDVKMNCLSDLGVPLDITADVVDLAFYDTSDRRNAVSLTLATAAITTALAGFCHKAITTAGMTLAAGTYYLFVKRTENVGGTIFFSRMSTKVTVR